MNKRNKLSHRNDYTKSLFAIAFISVSLLFLGLTYSSKAPPERVKTFFPLFGHFYPEKSTNMSSSMPNSRYGSGIR
tara:strand:+ start:354 stop:581 length:228 start_codon:yes stop_codon:yes gene_type:complete